MGGFPSRIRRAELGPHFQNARPVENPFTEMDAAAINAFLRQICGMNVVVPRVSVAGYWDATDGVFRTAHRGEAWSPDGSVALPTLARVSAGRYTLTFASSYNDENGVAVTTELKAARVSSLQPLTEFADRIESHAWVDADDPLVVQVRLWNTSGSGVDVPFWLEVL